MLEEMVHWATGLMEVSCSRLGSPFPSNISSSTVLALRVTTAQHLDSSCFLKRIRSCRNARTQMQLPQRML